MAHVLIQHVHSLWTKQSRGGDAARIRNAVPDALPLPPSVRAAPFVLHHALFVERDDFVQADVIRTGDSFADLDLKDLELSITPDSLNIRFHRNVNNAARSTPYPFTDVFSLSESQWGRLTYNGRFTAWNTGNWWYEKSVFNIGWFSCIDMRRFIDTEPTCDFSEMAHLR